jgi:hypothetical protein
MKKLFLTTLLLTISTFAQTTAAKPRTVIHAAKLFDAKAGRVLTNQYIVIEGDKIVSVGGAAPAGAKAIELPNVLPGLSMRTRTSRAIRDLDTRNSASPYRARH